MNQAIVRSLPLIIAFVALIQCGVKTELPKGDPDNRGLVVPDGFEVKVVADSVGPIPGVKTETFIPEIANAVPHLRITWDPGAVKLADASAYYPQAAIIGGWAAANDYYEPNKETLAKLIRGWAEANDYIIANSNGAMESLQKAHYSQTPLADINESFKAQKMFTSRDWKRLYSDGTVTNWLQQSTDFFMANAGIKDFTPASKYFDPSLYLKTIA